MSQLFKNVSLIHLQNLLQLHTSLPPTLAFEEQCFLTLAFNPIHYCGPPLVHSAVRGDKSPLPNMDAFLFPWICAALPWGYCTPISTLHTYKDTLTAPSTITPLSGRVKKYLRLFIVSPFPWVEMAFRKDGTEHSHSGEHILLGVMLIECRKKSTMLNWE